MTTFNNENVVQVVSAVPDGRIIAAQFQTVSYIKQWCITMNKKVPITFKGISDEHLNTAIWGMYIHFGHHAEKEHFELISSSYSAQLNKTIELFLYNIPSGIKLFCSGGTVLKVASFETLISKIEKSPGMYTLGTVHAMNIISGLEKTNIKR